MDDVNMVQVVEGPQSFKDDVLDYAFREGLVEACFENVRQAPGIHVFYEDPESLFEIVAVKVLNNVAMITDGHQGDFVLDGLLLVAGSHVCLGGVSPHTWERCLLSVLLMVDEFQSVIGLVAFSLHEIYLAVSTRTDLLYNVVIEGGVVHFEEI